MRTTFVVTLAVAALLALATAAPRGALAFFELDESIVGAPTRTVLPDGRIHYQLAEKNHEPFPDHVNARLGGHAVDPKDHHITQSGFAIMKAHWEVFKLEEHTAAHQTVCHEAGDKNMRMSIFDASPKLVDYLKNKKGSIVLTANANKHQCHGEAIFRFVDDAHFFTDAANGNKGEIVLITSKARYERIFDESRIDLDIKHPLITYISTSRDAPLPRFDLDAVDHGVIAHSAGAIAPTTPGAARIAEIKDRVIRTEVVPQHGKAPEHHDLGDANKQLIENLVNEPNTAVKGAFRQAVLLGCGWNPFCHIGKAISDAWDWLKKQVSNITSMFAKGFDDLVKAVGKGIQWAIDKVKSLLTIHVDKSQSLPLSKTFTKTLWRVTFVFDFDFECGFKFQLYIDSASLTKFHASVYGSLEVGGTAKMPQQTSSGETSSTLFTIPGFTIAFSIGPVPVWIQLTIPVVGGFDYAYTTELDAGFQVNMYARYGVEYTKSNGFTGINERSFSKKYWFNYEGAISATAFIGPQIRFHINSMVAAYCYVKFSLEGYVRLAIKAGEVTRAPDERCSGFFDFACKVRNMNKAVAYAVAVEQQRCSLLRVKLDLGLDISAGLDLDISAFGIQIYKKEFGPWALYSNKWNLLDVCKKQGSTVVRALPMAEESASSSRGALALAAAEDRRMLSGLSSALEHRTAATLDDVAITKLTSEDNGKIWTSEMACPAPNLQSYNFRASLITGPTGNDTIGDVAFLHISLSRNITIPENNSYSLVQQTGLYFLNRSITLGLKAPVILVPVSQEVADELSMPLAQLQLLTYNASGNPNVGALNLSTIDVQFGATDLNEASFSAAELCVTPGQTLSAQAQPVTNSRPAQPDSPYFARVMAALGKSLFPAFIRLVTDVLVVVLILAIIEFVIAWKGITRIVPAEHFPKTRQNPRTREYVWLGVSLSVGVLCFIWFIVGVNLTFAQIVGAGLAPNYTAPVQDNGSILVASGVETRVFTFKGASIRSDTCLQFYPCSPNCRDLCKGADYSWTDMKWPFCPDDAVITENGTCTKFAFDAIINAILAILFLLVGPVLAFKKCDTVYRRLIVTHACIMLSGMFLCLIWRRIHSFMTEVKTTMFDPTSRMIWPWTLFISEDAERSWEGPTVTFFVMVGVLGLLSIWEMYAFYMDTVEDRIVRYDASFENGANSVQATEYKKPGAADAPVTNASAAFRAEVAADLQLKTDEKKADGAVPFTVSAL